MTATIVPATTSVKYLKARNIDTDRLQRRRAFLLTNRGFIAADADARIILRARARELYAIEDALIDRGALPLADSLLGRRARFVPVKPNKGPET